MTDDTDVTDIDRKLACRSLIIVSVIVGGVLFCLLASSIVISLDDTLDKGQCTLARSTPTYPPIPVVTALDIQSKLPNRMLKAITPLNASNLGEVGRVTSIAAPIRKLMFDPDNTISLTNNQTWSHTNWEDVELDPQGKTIVYIEGRPSYPSIVRGCDIDTAHQVFAFSSDETANQIRFSPDGRLFAVNEGRGTITIYDAQTRARITTFSVLNGRRWVNTNQLAFSPDSSLLAFAMDDYQENEYTIRVWDIKTSKQLAILQGHTGEVLGLAFNNDGTLIASASIDGIVHLWGVIQQ
jgi:WD40 repeat protein